MTATISIGNGVKFGSGIGVGALPPITITYDQIVDPGDGELTGTGFTGTYCLVQLTPDQLSILQAQSSGYGVLFCYGTWAAGSVNTTQNGSDVVLSSQGGGVYQLYGTLPNWPEPQLGPWNMPVTISSVAGGF